MQNFWLSYFSLLEKSSVHNWKLHTCSRWLDDHQRCHFGNVGCDKGLLNYYCKLPWYCDVLKYYHFNFNHSSYLVCCGHFWQFSQLANYSCLNCCQSGSCNPSLFVIAIFGRTFSLVNNDLLLSASLYTVHWCFT